MSEQQNYANHKRFYPLFHFITVPILAINLILAVIGAFRFFGSLLAWWNVVLAFALCALALASRLMVLAVQDRLIRLEETVRMQRVLPEDLRGRISELSTGQMISLRFCADDELPDLARIVLTDRIGSRDEIKQRIRNWRADNGPRA